MMFNRDLPYISTCVRDVFDGCRWKFLSDLSWLGDVALRFLIDFMELDTCSLEVGEQQK